VVKPASPACYKWTPNLVRKHIVEKYHRGEPLTAEEQKILDVELARLPADKVWERIRSQIESRRKTVVIWPWFVRWPAITAGAAAVVVLLAGGLNRFQVHSVRTVAIIVVDSTFGGQSEPRRVSLPDGSAVTLSYGSSIRYAKAFEQRKVILAGQAYFDVVKREDPFIVESGQTTVQVLGTEFNWMHYPGVPGEITLLSGKIRLTRGNVDRELAPAERVVIREGNPVRVKVEKMERPEDVVAWMRARPAIVFDSMDLYAVIQRMAQYYQVGFHVDAGLQSGRPVNGILDLQRSLEQNLAPIKEMLKEYAHVDVTNGVIEVTN
jgi:ferric-dicitrate binding protein FerR (iron transport regulator)